jgi:hypothetical protein
MSLELCVLPHLALPELRRVVPCLFRLNLRAVRFRRYRYYQ